MIARVAWSLFLTGLVLGYGPCLLSCGPLLVSYIAATKESAWGGLKTYLIFSLTRLFVYFVFGIFIGFLGEFVIHRFFESGALRAAYFLFGLFLVAVGSFLMVERTPVGHKCNGFVHRYLGRKDTKSIVVFGLIVSLAPCLPLLAVFGYIALISDHWLKGAFYMSSFGLGTVISPMILLSMFAGWVARFLKKYDRILRILKILCGAVIVYLGMNLIF